MNWELMWEREEPCRCGKGKLLRRSEMDDWNRTRESSATLCEHCGHEERLRCSEWDKNFSEQRKLFGKAIAIATERHLKAWLRSCDGCTTKEAWFRYTNGIDYPSLGTFYKHVRQHGSLKSCLEQCFINQVGHKWRSLGISDADVEDLLERSREVWQRPLMGSRDIGAYHG